MFMRKIPTHLIFFCGTLSSSLSQSDMSFMTQFANLSQSPQYVYTLVGGLFWFLSCRACPWEKLPARLLKPFLSFKSYKTTLLKLRMQLRPLKLIDQFIFLLKSHSFLHNIFQKIFYLLRSKQSGAHRLFRLGTTKKKAASIENK